MPGKWGGYIKQVKTDLLNLDATMLDIAKESINQHRAEIRAIIDTAADGALRSVAQGSPRYKGKRNAAYRKKHAGRPYADGWEKDGYSGNWTIRNANKPQLTHLFKGTDQRETNRGYNRGLMPPNAHIHEAFKEADAYIENELKNI